MGIKKNVGINANISYNVWNFGIYRLFFFKTNFSYNDYLFHSTKFEIITLNDAADKNFLVEC